MKLLSVVSKSQKDLEKSGQSVFPSLQIPTLPSLPFPLDKLFSHCWPPSSSQLLKKYKKIINIRPDVCDLCLGQTNPLSPISSPGARGQVWGGGEQDPPSLTPHLTHPQTWGCSVCSALVNWKRTRLILKSRQTTSQRNILPWYFVSTTVSPISHVCYSCVCYSCIYYSPIINSLFIMSGVDNKYIVSCLLLSPCQIRMYCCYWFVIDLLLARINHI